jgi:hypothetical protein
MLTSQQVSAVFSPTPSCDHGPCLFPEGLLKPLEGTGPVEIFGAPGGMDLLLSWAEGGGN